MKAEDWKKQAGNAIEQGQNQNGFVAHCHPDNRKVARKAYSDAVRDALAPDRHRHDLCSRSSKAVEHPKMEDVGSTPTANNYKAHAQRLAETLKWIRKYPDVLEDKSYTRSIDQQLAQWEAAQ